MTFHWQSVLVTGMWLLTHIYSTWSYISWLMKPLLQTLPGQNSHDLFCMHAETRLSLRITHLSELKLTVPRWLRQGQRRWGLLPSCPTSPSTSPSTRARRRRNWPPSTEMWTTRRWPIDNNSINNNRYYGAFKALKTIYGSTENSEIIRNKTGRECLKLQNSNEKTNCKLCWLGKGSQPITLTRLLLASETHLHSLFPKYFSQNKVIPTKKNIYLFPKYFWQRKRFYSFPEYFWRSKIYYSFPRVSGKEKHFTLSQIFLVKVYLRPQVFLAK